MELKAKNEEAHALDDITRARVLTPDYGAGRWTKTATACSTGKRLNIASVTSGSRSRRSPCLLFRFSPAFHTRDATAPERIPRKRSRMYHSLHGTMH